jgi:hypothetical protein
MFYYDTEQHTIRVLDENGGDINYIEILLNKITKLSCENNKKKGIRKI